MILAYVAGLKYGPKGVAVAYSVVMLLWVLPAVAWSVYGTAISVRDILLTVSRPLASSIVAGGLALGVRFVYGSMLSPLLRLTLESSVLLVAFGAILLFATGQFSFYVNLFRALLNPSSLKETPSVSP